MAKRRLILFAATVVVAAIVAACVIVALGDTAETPSPATPTVVVAIAPTSTLTPAITRPPATRTPAVPQLTPRPVATSVGTPRPTATPLATPTKPLTLSPAPALNAADKAVTLAPPQSPLPDHDGKSIVLYDTEARTSKDFGTGALSFSPFGKDMFTYVDAAGEAWLVELPGLTSTPLGKTSSASFAGDYRITLGNGPSAMLYDTRTSTTTSLAPLSQAERNAILGVPFEPQLNLPAGLTRGSGAINLGDDPCGALTGNPQRLCWASRPEDVVLQDAQGRIVYSFRALRVAPAGAGELLIATPPVCTESASVRTVPCIDLLAKLGSKELAYDDPEFATGTTNLYILDLTLGTARFVATSHYNLQTLIQNANWPLAADANYVVWTDGYCGPPRGNTRIYDRKAGTVTELNGTYWFGLHNGKLGLGDFGARVVIDPATQQVLGVLSQVSGDVRWSADYRYAAVSAPQGHGGLCP